MAQHITTREADYSQWYLDIVEQADLAENSPVRGCMVIKPWGYSIWENIRTALDGMFKETGHQNAYFPLFIPKSFLAKEAKHVEGFAQESAIVTHYRLKTDPITKEVVVDPDAKLTEELVVRPTSETIIMDTFSRWVQSYRDLPLLINQWANVVRWELRTRPFLRTAEFLWQEGHTCHATSEEAEQETMQMLKVYQRLAEEWLAIPVIPGQKSESEKFAGADHTYTIEAMMQDGKALQSGTSHHLGQNFSKAFDIQFTDRDGKRKLVWTTSWGLSTRIMGALIMTHSDDNGLVLPPMIAPQQIVILPIWKKKKDSEAIINAIAQIKAQLISVGLRVTVDERDYMSVGEKHQYWEKRGVPVRLEVGPRDLEQQQVVVVRRDTLEKEPLKLTMLEGTMPVLMETIQKNLYDRALKFRQSRTHEVNSYDELKSVIENGGFALAHWDGTTETEKAIQAETKATIRCIPFDSALEAGTCVYSGKASKQRVLFAKSY